MVKVEIDGEPKPIGERVKKIIRFLALNEPAIAAPTKQTLIFHCAGSTVRYEMELTEVGDCGEAKGIDVSPK